MKLAKVKSLVELKRLAASDPRYAALMSAASANLGGPSSPQDACYRWLLANALETSERGVVAEVNFCRDIVEAAAAVRHPFCQKCGWHKGGIDSWDGAKCKCGHREPPYKGAKR